MRVALSDTLKTGFVVSMSIYSNDLDNTAFIPLYLYNINNLAST